MDPFHDFHSKAPIDKQGWRSRHDYLSSSVIELRPKVAAEIGVWKGMSTIAIAKAMKENDIDGAVVAIDTWLGSSEHWLNETHFRSLNHKSGRQTLQDTCMSNILDENLQDYVVPLPIDSMNASEIFEAKGIVADLIHLDAGHNYVTVLGDLRSWWPLLAAGGILIGDDYLTDDHWPDVKKAFDEFALEVDVRLEHHAGKCRLRKPDPFR